MPQSAFDPARHRWRVVTVPDDLRQMPPAAAAFCSLDAFNPYMPDQCVAFIDIR